MNRNLKVETSTHRRPARTLLGRLLQRHRAHSGDESGFTLVELLIVTVITPLVIGGLSVMMLGVFRNQAGVSNRINGSLDMQTSTATFTGDVQSAIELTTNAASTPAGCTTTGTPVLSLQENNNVIITYARVAQGTKYDLFRLKCSLTSPTVVSSTRMTTDVSSTQSATVTCPACSGLNVPSSAYWINMIGVTQVSLNVSEPTTGASFSLIMTPRVWTSYYGFNYKNPYPFAPIDLLAASACVTGGPADLTLSGAAVVNVSSGAGGVIDNSACNGAIVMSGSAKIRAATLVTANTTPANSMSITGVPSYPTPTYAAPVGDPLAGNLVAPGPTGATGTGSCTGTTTVTCTPGIYASALSIGGGSTTATFLPGNYTFNGAVTFGSGTAVTTGAGNYAFNAGLTISGAAPVIFGTGNYTFSGTTSTSNALSVGGSGSLTSGTGGVLLYIKQGTAVFSGAGSVTLTGSASSYGVSIWDAGATGTTNPLTLGGSSCVHSSFGGVYVPAGEITNSGASSFTASFMVADSILLSGSSTINVG